MKAKTGGTAFPAKTIQRTALGNHTVEVYSAGMALRDYFAAKAMQGYLANPWQAKELDDTGDSSSEQMRIVAEISYAMADAMLKARSRRTP